MDRAFKFKKSIDFKKNLNYPIIQIIKHLNLVPMRPSMIDIQANINTTLVVLSVVVGVVVIVGLVSRYRCRKGCP